VDTVVMVKIDRLRFALPVDHVKKVIWAVEITPLPGQSQRLLGLINVEGLAVPVANFRNLINLPDRELELDDHMIVVDTNNGPIAIVIDSVEQVLHCRPEQLQTLDASTQSFAGAVVKLEDEMIFVIDPNMLISSADLGKKPAAAAASNQAVL